MPTEFEKVKSTFESRTGKTLKHLEKLKGLSNHVFKITDTEGNFWIFKILLSSSNDPFKKMERLAMALVAEMQNSTLFDDGGFRIETFIPNEDTTLEQVMRQEDACKIMRAVAAFNRLGAIQASEPNWPYILRKDSALISDRIAYNLQGLEPAERLEFESMLSEIGAISEFLFQQHKFDSLVLSHNDLFYRNIIFDTDRQRYVLIDFEYAGYNPFGMDVFQFVNEFLVDYNVPEKPFFKLRLDNYPPEEFLRELVRHYLFFFANEKLLGDMPDGDKLLAFVKETDEFKAVNEAEVERILALFPYFGALTNIYWFYWALFLFKVENIALDYVAFAKAKFQMVLFFLEKMNKRRKSEIMAE